MSLDVQHLKQPKQLNRHALRYSIWLLKSTGLYLDLRNKRLLIRILSGSATTAIFLLVIAEVHYQAYEDLVSSSDIVSSILDLFVKERALATMIYFMYWQFSGKMRTLLQIFETDVVSAFRPTCSIRKVDRIVTFIYLVGVILRNMVLDVGLIVATLAVSRGAGNNVAKLGSLYGFNYGFIISVLIVSYRVFASAAVSCFQVVVTLSLRIVVRRFNKHLSEVKSEKADGKELAQELRHKMQTHMNLAIIVSKVDRIFRNHTLLCLALAIPRTINAARNFQALSSGTIPADASKIAAVMSNLLNAVADLIAFTAIPATVNTALWESERALCQNTDLWKHYDPEVYQVATAFLLQTRQATLGFTAGGIVTITHTLLFTVASLIVTYLTIVTAQQNPVRSANSTLI